MDWFALDSMPEQAMSKGDNPTELQIAAAM